jgi:hypothetical protein
VVQIAALVTRGSIIITRPLASKIYRYGQSNRRIYSEKEAANWWPVVWLPGGHGNGGSD